MTAATDYHFAVFAYQETGDPDLISSAAVANSQPTMIANFSAIGDDSIIDLAWLPSSDNTCAAATDIVIVARQSFPIESGVDATALEGAGLASSSYVANTNYNAAVTDGVASDLFDISGVGAGNTNFVVYNGPGDSPVNIQISGVTNGQDYFFKAFLFDDGAGDVAEAVEANAKPLGNPPPPSAMAIACSTENQINLTWDRPTGTFGDEWDGVAVYAKVNDNVLTQTFISEDAPLDDNNAVIGVGVTTGVENGAEIIYVSRDNLDGDIFISNLQNANSYSFTAHAFRDIVGTGNDKFSVASGTVTAANPGKITGLVAVSNNQQVELSWTNPTDNASCLASVVIVANETAVEAPINQTNLNKASVTYSGAVADYGSAITQSMFDLASLGTDDQNRLVFNSLAETATITNLVNAQQYEFKVFLTGDQSGGRPTFSTAETVTSTPSGPTSTIAEATTYTTIGGQQTIAPGEPVFSFTYTDDNGSGGDDLDAELSQIIIKKGTNNNVGNWTNVINGATLTDNDAPANVISATLIQANDITFGSLDSTPGDIGYIGDNQSKTYTLHLWLKQGVQDGDVFEFDLATADITSSNPLFGTPNTITSANTIAVDRGKIHNAQPILQNQSDQGFDVVVDLNESDVTVYYMFTEVEVTPTPSSADVRNNNGGVLGGTFNYATANTPQTATILGLNPLTQYYAYITATDADDNNSLTQVTVPTNLTTLGDLAPPTLITPAINQFANSLEIEVAMSENGFVNYALYPDEPMGGNSRETNITVNDILSGDDPFTMGSAIEFGAFDITTPEADFSQLISFLTASTAYDVYLVGEDDETPGKFSAITKLDASTTAVTAGGADLNNPTINDLCVGGFVTLDPIQIDETASDDFTIGNNQTLILTLPDGFEFNTTASHSVAGIPLVSTTNLNSLTLDVESTFLTVTYNVGGQNRLDRIEISGLEVQASIATQPSSVSLLRLGSEEFGGTAVINGNEPGSGRPFATFQSFQSPVAPTAFSLPFLCENEDLSARVMDITSNATTYEWYNDSDLNNHQYTGVVTAFSQLGVDNAITNGASPSEEHTFYLIDRDATSACPSTATEITMTINRQPIANIISIAGGLNIASANELCKDDQVIVQGVETTGQISAVAYKWSYDDDSEIQVYDAGMDMNENITTGGASADKSQFLIMTPEASIAPPESDVTIQHDYKLVITDNITGCASNPAETGGGVKSTIDISVLEVEDITITSPLAVYSEAVLDAQLIEANPNTTDDPGNYTASFSISPGSGLSAINNVDGTADFTPSDAGQGQHTITWAIENDATGCQASESLNLIVTSSNASVGGANEKYCNEDIADAEILVSLADVQSELDADGSLSTDLRARFELGGSFTNLNATSTTGRIIRYNWIDDKTIRIAINEDINASMTNTSIVTGNFNVSFSDGSTTTDIGSPDNIADQGFNAGYREIDLRFNSDLTTLIPTPITNGDVLFIDISSGLLDNSGTSIFENGTTVTVIYDQDTRQRFFDVWSFNPRTAYNNIIGGLGADGEQHIVTLDLFLVGPMTDELRGTFETTLSPLPVVEINNVETQYCVTDAGFDLADDGDDIDVTVDGSVVTVTEYQAFYDNAGMFVQIDGDLGLGGINPFSGSAVDFNQLVTRAFGDASAGAYTTSTTFRIVYTSLEDEDQFYQLPEDDLMNPIPPDGCTNTGQVDFIIHPEPTVPSITQSANYTITQRFLNYTGDTGFNVGQSIVGRSSGATAVIDLIDPNDDDPTSGVMAISGITNTFLENEFIDETSGPNREAQLFRADDALVFERCDGDITLPNTVVFTIAGIDPNTKYNWYTGSHNPVAPTFTDLDGSLNTASATSTQITAGELFGAIPDPSNDNFYRFELTKVEQRQKGGVVTPGVDLNSPDLTFIGCEGQPLFIEVRIYENPDAPEVTNQNTFDLSQTVFDNSANNTNVNIDNEYIFEFCEDEFNGTAVQNLNAFGQVALDISVIPYDNSTGNFNVSDVVEGDNSGATAEVTAVNMFDLAVTNVVGAFEFGEQIFVQGTPAITADVELEFRWFNTLSDAQAHIANPAGTTPFHTGSTVGANQLAIAPAFNANTLATSYNFFVVESDFNDANFDGCFGAISLVRVIIHPEPTALEADPDTDNFFQTEYYLCDANDLATIVTPRLSDTDYTWYSNKDGYAEIVSTTITGSAGSITVTNAAGTLSDNDFLVGTISRTVAQVNGTPGGATFNVDNVTGDGFITNEPIVNSVVITDDLLGREITQQDLIDNGVFNNDISVETTYDLWVSQTTNDDVNFTDIGSDFRGCESALTQVSITVYPFEPDPGFAAYDNTSALISNMDTPPDRLTNEIEERVFYCQGDIVADYEFRATSANAGTNGLVFNWYRSNVNADQVGAAIAVADADGSTATANELGLVGLQTVPTNQDSTILYYLVTQTTDFTEAQTSQLNVTITGSVSLNDVVIGANSGVKAVVAEINGSVLTIVSETGTFEPGEDFTISGMIEGSIITHQPATDFDGCESNGTLFEIVIYDVPDEPGVYNLDFTDSRPTAMSIVEDFDSEFNYCFGDAVANIQVSGESDDMSANNNEFSDEFFYWYNTEADALMGINRITVADITDARGDLATATELGLNGTPAAGTYEFFVTQAQDIDDAANVTPDFLGCESAPRKISVNILDTPTSTGLIVPSDGCSVDPIPTVQVTNEQPGDFFRWYTLARTQEANFDPLDDTAFPFLKETSAVNADWTPLASELTDGTTVMTATNTFVVYRINSVNTDGKDFLGCASPGVQFDIVRFTEPGVPTITGNQGANAYEFCEDDDISSTTFTVASVDNNAIYTWYAGGNATNPTNPMQSALGSAGGGSITFAQVEAVTPLDITSASSTTIFVTQTTNSICESVGQPVTIQVNALPILNFTTIAPSGELCVVDSDINLLANEIPGAGETGVFTITDVSDNPIATGLTDNNNGTAVFNPLDAVNEAAATDFLDQSLTVKVSYTFTDASNTNCQSTTTQVVTINGLPSVAISLSRDGLTDNGTNEYCIDESALTVFSGEASGTFDNPNGQNGPITDAGNGTASINLATAFNVVDNGANARFIDYPIRYTFTDANGCTNTTTRSIRVNNLPEPTFEVEVDNVPVTNGTTTRADICIDETMVVRLEDTTVGMGTLVTGDFSAAGSGFSLDRNSTAFTKNAEGDYTFRPSVAVTLADGQNGALATQGFIDFVITYTYTNDRTCLGSSQTTDQRTIRVFRIPVPDISTDQNGVVVANEYCRDFGLLQLNVDDIDFNSTGFEGTGIFRWNNGGTLVTLPGVIDNSITVPVGLEDAATFDMAAAYQYALDNSLITGATRQATFDIVYEYQNSLGCTDWTFGNQLTLVINPFPDIDFQFDDNYDTADPTAYCVDEGTIDLTAEILGTADIANDIFSSSFTVPGITETTSEDGIINSNDGSAILDVETLFKSAVAEGLGTINDLFIDINVQLTLQDANRCETTITRTLTINNLPVPEFDIRRNSSSIITTGDVDLEVCIDDVSTESADDVTEKILLTDITAGQGTFVSASFKELNYDLGVAALENFSNGQAYFYPARAMAAAENVNALLANSTFIDFTFDMTYENSNGCVGNTLSSDADRGVLDFDNTMTIRVYRLPVPTIEVDYEGLNNNDRYCIDDGTPINISVDAIQFDVTGGGGTYKIFPSAASAALIQTGEAAVFNPRTAFDAAVANGSVNYDPIEFKIAYEYATGKGCFNTSDTLLLTVNPLPIVTIETITAGPVVANEYCISEGSIELSAAAFFENTDDPASGSGQFYSNFGGVDQGGFGILSTGAGRATFDLNAAFDDNGAERRTHVITYQFTDVEGCINSADTTIVINKLPEVTLAAVGGCDKEPVTFNATVIDLAEEDEIVEYLWDFEYDAADGFTNQPVVTTGPEAVHTYQNFGLFEAAVMVRSVKACLSPVATAVAQIGEIPSTNFTYEGLAVDQPFEFIGSPGDISFGVIDTLIMNYDDGAIEKRGFDLPDLAELQESDLTFNHQFAEAGVYQVALTVITRNECTQTHTRLVPVLPKITVASRFEQDFENPVVKIGILQGEEEALWIDGWVPDVRELDNKANEEFFDEEASAFVGITKGQENSWDWGPPNNPNGLSTAADGNNAIVTNLEGVINTGEASWIYSPVFDLSALERPMVRFDRFVNFESPRNGVVIQYSTNNGLSWELIHQTFEDNLILNTGINWYENQAIQGDPGGIGGTNGDQIGWSQLSNDDVWKEARHKLDIIPADERTNVILRFALGANAADGQDGFGFDNFVIEERQRIVLVEQFGGTVIGSVVEANAELTNRMNDTDVNNGDGVVITYQTDLNNDQAEDPINLSNPSDPNSRVFFYGIESVPSSILNGETNLSGTFNTRDLPWSANDFNIEALQDPEVQLELVLNATVAGDNVAVTANIGNPNGIAFGEETRLYIAVVEREVEQNGTILINVLRQFLPSGSGNTIEVDANLNPVPISHNWRIDRVDNPDNLAVVAFIQDNGSKRILQAATVNVGDKDDDIVTSVDDKILNSEMVTLYPNPVRDELWVAFDNATTEDFEWKVMNQVGQQIAIGSVSSGEINFSVDVTDLPSGMYFLFIGNEEKKYNHFKFIVRH
ncbi:MAG: T9SS type A sorting domain-containing protein [Cyclobacteriaceae bacterium]